MSVVSRLFYVRPDDDWLCGRSDDPCRLGPQTGGRCAARYECEPHRKGDRWHCARSQAAGGACSESPLPDGRCGRPPQICIPRRSPRGKLKIAWRWTLAATIGALAVAMGGDFQERLFFPGDLAQSHAHLTACDSCHNPGFASPAAWPGMLAGFNRADPAAGAHKCLDCHIVGERPFMPHGAASLPAAKAESAGAPLTTRAARALFSGVGDNLSCAVCHREHRGFAADITAIANDRCVFCHQKQFADFQRGHPELKNYGGVDTVRIVFDHENHFQRHFPDENASRECADCHVPDGGGRRMQLRGFDRACAACHLNEITGRKSGVPREVAFVNVPGLDLEALDNIGDWPILADGEPDAFLKLLLARRLSAEVLQKIDDADLADLSAADADTIAAANALAWETKRLFADLSRRGPRALMAADDISDDTEAAALAAGLASEVVDAALGEWFPRLSDDIAGWEQGAPPPTRPVEPSEYQAVAPLAAFAIPAESSAADDGDDDLLADDSFLLDEDDLLADDDIEEEEEEEEKSAADEAPDINEWRRYGGWRVGDYRLEYRPARHADDFLRGWHAFAAANAPELLAALRGEDIAGKCAKCHSLSPADKGAAAQTTIHWRGLRIAPDMHFPVAFSHAKHLAAPGDDGCFTCHEINRDADYTAGIESGEPISNFAPMQKSACAACHTAGLADCATCHNYHYGEVRLQLAGSDAKIPEAPETPLDAAADGG